MGKMVDHRLPVDIPGMKHMPSGLELCGSWILLIVAAGGLLFFVALAVIFVAGLFLQYDPSAFLGVVYLPFVLFLGWCCVVACRRLMANIDRLRALRAAAPLDC